MAINIKKTFIDPLTASKIKIPSVKSIMFLKEAGVYESFKDLMESQNSKLLKGSKKVLITAAVGVTTMAASAVQYAIVKNTNDKFFDAAELMINEAAAFHEINQ